MKEHFYAQLARAPHRQRGGALITVIVMTAVITVLAGIALTVTSSAVTEVEHERMRIQALYSAEAGINEGLAQLAEAWRTGAAIPSALGSDQAPAGEEGNRFWTIVIDNPDDTFTIQATGQAGGQRRTLEIIASPVPPDPFEHSMYAGNLSNDPAYDLRLSGYGGQADQVTGNLYSGGDLTVAEDSSLIGDASASGVLTGVAGKEGLLPQIPQLLDIDYESFHDYNVAASFLSAPRLSDNAGGTAGQLPVSDPSHIFRLNPSDRTADTDGTAKDDYFLEDPYESVTADSTQDGSNAFKVSLPAAANNKVYFIDGNLWLHNKNSYSLKLKNEGLDPTKVTFVVKGNVYFSDNLFYNDPNLDGAAFIALADPNVDDSGNIYFGDPTFGTMKFAEALMFAENNFYDNNLDASGSTNVEIRGSMTAGNQVSIKRDYLLSSGIVAHTQLKLTFDARQTSGSLNLPGIPLESDQANGYQIASWREVPVPNAFVAPALTFEVDMPLDAKAGVPDPSIDPDTDGDWRKRWGDNFQGWNSQKRNSKWKRNQSGGY